MHVATVRAQIRPDPVECVGDPATHVMGVQSMHEQEAGYQVVGDQGVQHGGVRPSAECRHYSRQGRAVEFDDLANQLLGALTRDRPTGRRRIQQRLDPIARRAPQRIPRQLLEAISHTSLPGRRLCR